MDENERQELIRDLRALFAEMRRLGYLNGYTPRDGNDENGSLLRAGLRRVRLEQAPGVHSQRRTRSQPRGRRGDIRQPLALLRPSPGQRVVVGQRHLEPAHEARLSRRVSGGRSWSASAVSSRRAA